jgi:hypothetical protein
MASACPKCGRPWDYSEVLSQMDSRAWSTLYACLRCRKAIIERKRFDKRDVEVIDEPFTDDIFEAARQQQAEESGLVGDEESIELGRGRIRALLRSKDEMRRLFGVAMLEEHFFNSYGPRDYAKVLAEVAREDASQVVRTAALRALYHESSECWPFVPEDRRIVRELIDEIIQSAPGQTLDRMVASEIISSGGVCSVLRADRDRCREGG